MKKIITAFIFCFLCGECFSQAGEWVWIKGDSVPSQPGNYGVQGVPSPTNNPPSLYEPSEWTDLNGNFWLFGGKDNNGELTNDLWKYDPLNNEWTWMKGPGIAMDTGIFGTQGVPSLLNIPPARGYAVPSWIDTLGNFWVFGGIGVIGPSTYGPFNDLWKYNPLTNEWTWMKGPNISFQPGVYGIQGIPNSLNNPNWSSECPAAWTDNNNNLWHFGGQGQGWDSYNTLWRYEIAANQWTWMKGDSVNGTGVYGTMGIENPLNTPGPRWGYCHWKDNSGNLWLFAGGDYFNATSFNDIWRYNPFTNNWTWMGGDSVINMHGSYGTKCTASPTNIPGTRYENRSSWTDQHGDFLVFGGLTVPLGAFNDLWKYCMATNQWIWINGDSVTNSSGYWGTMGVSSPLNLPSARSGSVGWKGQNGHLYLFGGYWGPSNDLWKYTIDTTCGVCPAPNSIPENNPSKADELLVFPNPTNSSLTILFTSSEKQNIELRIYNTVGKQIYFSEEEITTGKFEKEINVEKWSDGIYFLQVKTKEGNTNRKVIINH